MDIFARTYICIFVHLYLHVHVSISMYARDICTFHKCTDTRPIYLNTERVRKSEREREREREKGWRTCVRVPLYVCEERLDAGAGSHGDDSFGLAAASTWIPYVDPRSRPPALTYYPPPSITPLARSSLSYSLVRGPPPSFVYRLSPLVLLVSVPPSSLPLRRLSQFPPAFRFLLRFLSTFLRGNSTVEERESSFPLASRSWFLFFSPCIEFDARLLLFRKILADY